MTEPFPSAARPDQRGRRAALPQVILSVLLVFAFLLAACDLNQPALQAATETETVQPTESALTVTPESTQPTQTTLTVTSETAQPTESTSTPAPESAFVLTDCYHDAPGLTSPLKAQCGQVEVPENREQPEGRKILLKVVVLKAISSSPAPDPLFLLAGGPGQAASEAFTYLAGSLERVRFKRDLVMVDQRGTGQSNRLQCKAPAQTPEVIRIDQPIEQQLADMKECLAGFAESDLTQYTTDIAVQDLDDVRHALGYEQVNLLGVSYGTRAALYYLALYPNRVRSIVLDGVVPMGWVLGASMRADSQRAIDMIFNRCENDSACREKFPNLRREFIDLLASLKSQPVETTIPNPVTGEPQRILISPLMLSSTVRLMSYSDMQSALVPLMIHSAAQGDYTLLASQFLLMAGSVGESMSYGMYYSVWCYEDLPSLPQEGELGDYYFDPDLNQSRAVCDLWPKNTHDLTPPKITRADTPVLLISGENDPVTPPANGEEVIKDLPNSLHLILPGMGHNNFYVGCLPTIVRDFIDAASPQELQTDCLQEIHPLPFFLNPVGPVAGKSKP